jgi:mRNA interferase RelE/StbE
VNDPTSSPRYTVELTAAAEKTLNKLDKPAARRVTAALLALGANPRPAGIKAMVGKPETLRHRVGDYRIVYRIIDNRLIVLVLAIGHRRDVYRERS